MMYKMWLWSINSYPFLSFVYIYRETNEKYMKFIVRSIAVKEY